MNRRKYPRTALSALALCLFAAAAMLVSPAASGQKGNRAAEEIGRVLESFETVTLDPAAVLGSVRGEGSVTLQTARGPFDLVVEPYDVRSADYRAWATGEGGVRTEIPRAPSNSWRGHVRGQEGTTVVRLYLDGQKVQGIIITPSETFFVEPARDLSAAAGSQEFVFYEESSVKEVGGECVEATLAGKVASKAAKAGATSAAAGTPGADEAFGPMPEARIAAEADFEFFQKNGSNKTATVNDITSIITQVDGIYEHELGISLRLVDTHVWETSNDPYTLTNTNDTDANGNPIPDILSEFADKFDGVFFGAGLQPPARELAHMFTGKNIAGTTIGIAYRGALCDIPNASYGVSESRHADPTPLSAAERVALTAHEIGHNFGATHTGPSGNPEDPAQQVPGCNVPAGAIMQPAVSSSTGFCQFSRDQITSHVTGTGGSCLARLTAPGCTYAVTPSSQFFPASGGTGTVNVASNCAWGVAEGSPWLTFGSEAGAGDGSTSYTVAANTTTGPRETAVDIGAQRFIVRQAAASGCGSTPISIGQTVSGSLASTDCRAGQTGRVDAFVDLYTFRGRAGQRVRIQMNAALKPASDPPPAAALDTFLYLLGPDGAIIATNDDIVTFDDTDSRVPVSGFFTLPATGVYTVEATSYDNNDAGNYTLTLTDNSSSNSVSFSSSAYAVSEGTGADGLGFDGTGFRVVTVTRTGTDTTGAATVDYATSDGTAARLKDYEQALGTLVFAPNETSKTFTVFVPDDALAEGAETVTLTLSNAAGTTL
ncbi:MAG TPA: M12 family metallo-peptidase, partial [Pyrinomonadaceae bacterium]